jgi:cytosine/adenosine deaminase-related metal-dependent hydrolase
MMNTGLKLRPARSISPISLLESATIAGARALGFEAEFGTIDSGKRDALVAVQLDGHVQSVEECLVSGVGAAQISWIPAS